MNSTDSEEAPNKNMMIFGVILFLFFASFAAMFGITIWELTKKTPERNVLFLGDGSTQLQITSSWKTIYNYYTKNISTTLRSYTGEYLVNMNNSSGVDFRVVDENGNVLGSTVDRGSSYVESVIPFNSGDRKISNIILQYKSTNNAIVSQIKINVNK